MKIDGARCALGIHRAVQLSTVAGNTRRRASRDRRRRRCKALNGSKNCLALSLVDKYRPDEIGGATIQDVPARDRVRRRAERDCLYASVRSQREESCCAVCAKGRVGAELEICVARCPLGIHRAVQLSTVAGNTRRRASRDR